MSMKKYTHFLPVLIIALLIIAFYKLGFSQYFTLTAFKHYHQTLQTCVLLHPVLSALSFIGTYIALTALALPVSIFLALLGGFLFPQPLCTLYSVLGATAGSSLLFLALRPAVTGSINKKEKPLLKKMREGFRKNAASYLLFLHFIHVLPFWCINVAAAFFNVRFQTFLWTMLVGILPATFVYTEAGRGMEKVFANGDHFSLDTVFNTQVKVALIGLALLALIPIIIRKYKKQK
jgi:uncharacterized membrane protein YdjX (TVP38/TMEM64 family)